MTVTSFWVTVTYVLGYALGDSHQKAGDSHLGRLHKGSAIGAWHLEGFDVYHI